MTDDIDRIARAWYARFHAKDWDDQSAASRQFMMHATEELVASARDAIGLTASDLAGLAEGKAVVVPVEPTWVMQIAGRDAVLADDDELDLSTDDARAAYIAMLAARPGAKEE